MAGTAGTVNVQSGILGQLQDKHESAGPMTSVFAGAGVNQVNLTTQEENNLIVYARSVYIDNSANANAVTLDFGNGYKVNVPANKQAWMPAITGRPIIMNLTSAGAGTTILWLASWDVEPYVW